MWCVAHDYAYNVQNTMILNLLGPYAVSSGEYVQTLRRHICICAWRKSMRSVETSGTIYPATEHNIPLAWNFIVTTERTSSIEGKTCFEYVSRIHILYNRLLYSTSTPEGRRLQPRKQLCYNDCSLLLLQDLRFSEMKRTIFSETSVIF